MRPPAVDDKRNPGTSRFGISPDEAARHLREARAPRCGGIALDPGTRFYAHPDTPCARSSGGRGPWTARALRPCA
jgi:hypothetical protein